MNYRQRFSLGSLIDAHYFLGQILVIHLTVCLVCGKEFIAPRQCQRLCQENKVEVEGP